MTYSVLLKTDIHPFPTRDLGKLRAEVLGGVAYDHMARLNMAFGWIAEGVDRYVAAALVETLEKNGFAAAVKEDAAFTRLGDDCKVGRAVLSPESLSIETDATGTWQTIDWGDVDLVAIGGVPDSRLKTAVVTDRRAKPVRRKVIQHVKARVLTAKFVEEKGALLQLYVSSPRFVIAIRPTAFFYDYLADRRKSAAGENFALLLDDLQQFATGAYWPARTREYIDNGARAAGEFKNVPEFSRYHQWIYEAFVDVSD